MLIIAGLLFVPALYAWINIIASLDLREMTQVDFSALCKILQDDDVMYAYEGAFSIEEIRQDK